jgi:hypothetical protein
MERTRVFIGSSKEGIPVARSLAANFEHDNDIVVTIWTAARFRLGESTLVSLEQGLAQYDFGIFVFTPDDVTSKRGKEYPAPRDNVVFELGMFLGRLGRTRCCAVRPRDVDLHIATDLSGITLAEYSAGKFTDSPEAAVSDAAEKIRRQIRDVPSLLREMHGPERDETELIECIADIAARSGPALTNTYVPLLELLGKEQGVLRSKWPTALLAHGAIQRVQGKLGCRHIFVTLQRIPAVADAALIELALHYYSRGALHELHQLRPLVRAEPWSRGAIELLCELADPRVATISPDALEGHFAEVPGSDVARYLALPIGLHALLHDDRARFVTHWDSARQQQYGLTPWPLISQSFHYNRTFISAIVASDDAKSRQLADSLDRNLREDGASGQGQLMARICRRMRTSKGALSSLNALTKEAPNGKKGKWQLNESQVAARLEQMETAIWRWAR